MSSSKSSGEFLGICFSAKAMESKHLVPEVDASPSKKDDNIYKTKLQETIQL